MGCRYRMENIEYVWRGLDTLANPAISIFGRCLGKTGYVCDVFHRLSVRYTLQLAEANGPLMALFRQAGEQTQGGQSQIQPMATSAFASFSLGASDTPHEMKACKHYQKLKQEP
jgi:hypothetical protein